MFPTLKHDCNTINHEGSSNSTTCIGSNGGFKESICSPVTCSRGKSPLVPSGNILYNAFFYRWQNAKSMGTQTTATFWSEWTGNYRFTSKHFSGLPLFSWEKKRLKLWSLMGLDPIGMPPTMSCIWRVFFRKHKNLMDILWLVIKNTAAWLL